MALINPQDVSETICRQIIDVRTPDEFLQEHIPGSLNIPMEQIGTRMSELPEHAILTCRTGRRAAEAKVFLEAQGCCDLALLDGGLQGWKAAGRLTLSFRKGFSIMQQVQIIAGSMILLGSFVKPLWFLAPLAGFGLLFAGLTNTCLMASFLSRLPWNRLSGSHPGNCSLN